MQPPRLVTSKAAVQRRRRIGRCERRPRAELKSGPTNGCRKVRRNSPLKPRARACSALNTSCTGKQTTSTTRNLRPERRWPQPCPVRLRPHAEPHPRTLKHSRDDESALEDQVGVG